MKSIIGKFIDGGPVFTVVIFICLLVILALFFLALVKKGDNQKSKELMTHIGWFAVAWGFMGRTFGLISAFNAVEASGELTPKLLAGGLKMALVDPLFGIFVFVVARLAIIILVSLQKK
ncbi:MotA/TolQ/ExbB proton channel family protein [Maribellus maritimus]|uniref:MotA/TolQ/ExbB proton channel family protein n=1 Tax=Maribellus maritimus TaxID=2870838 RepID=UPI001EEC1AE8|nr:MotA/TolQ/ExbB proton channel family protein [Maribellus maritimus]MCG6187073.1 MotA/TolQ/ExbB proton channel family protein [Maribellus maritimus]